MRREIVAVNPCDGLEFPPPARRRERIASPSEAAALIAALPVADRVLWSIAVYAGLRAGEILDLQRGDVDLAAGRIHVRRSWDPTSGAFVDPKSKAGCRVVPIAGMLRDELLEHRMRTESVSSAPDALVVARRNGLSLVHSAILARARRAWQRVKLQPLGLHEARSHCCQHLDRRWAEHPCGEHIRGPLRCGVHAEPLRAPTPGDHDHAKQTLDRFLEAHLTVR